MRYHSKADCGSCKRGQNYGIPAEFYATGKNEAGNPFHGYLCGNHAEAMLEDGAKLKLRSLARKIA